MKFQFLDDLGKFGRVITERSCSCIRRHLHNAVSAQVVLLILEILERQAAGSAARRHYFQGKRSVPAAGTDPAILMPRHGSGTEEAFFRENQVQKTIQQPARIRIRQISDCGEIGFRSHNRSTLHVPGLQVTSCRYSATCNLQLETWNCKKCELEFEQSFLLKTLTLDAELSPWHGFQPFGLNFFSAIGAFPIGLVVDAAQCVLD